MTTSGKHVVDDFETLPDVEKREVLAGILRIARTIDDPEIQNEELLSSADQIFLEYSAGKLTNESAEPRRSVAR